MLPVARANLDNICCICLVDIQPSVFKQKVYDVKMDKKLSKILKLTAHITVLKNPLNLKYAVDYCRKVCEICFLKTQYSFSFREKIIASAVTLKELFDNGSLDEEEDIKKLQHFCRICLSRQNDVGNNNCQINNKYLKWIKDCSGIRFSTLRETETFRIKEGTNINELVTIHDELFPKQLCQICLKKLRNVDEFRSLATHSFEYMISIMADDNDFQVDLLIRKDINKFKKEIIWQKMPQTQQISLRGSSTSQSEKAYFQNDIFNNHELATVSYSEDFVPNIDKNEYAQSQELVECDYQYPPNIDLNDYSFIEIIEKQHHMENNFDYTDVLPGSTDGSAIHSKNSISCNEMINYQGNVDGDHNFFETDNEESPLTDSDEWDIEKEPLAKYSKQQNKKVKLKISRKHKKQKSQENYTQNKNEKAENFVCDLCLKTLSSKKALKRHKASMHSGNITQQESTGAEKLSNTCKICSKYFKRKHHLREHINAVHEKQKPFQCSYCSNTFTSNNSRRVHELIHSGEFPFVCEWCKKGFRRPYQLKIHIERHTTTPELLCPICKRSQNTKEELRNHLRIHDEKRSQCPWCGKLFTRYTHLKDHQNAVHLKLRPFKCEFCDMSFGDRKTRRVHERSHTEDRPIACNICGRGFTLYVNFKRHLKQCHPIENKTKISGHSNIELQ